jgi:hypothetical protein
MILVTGQRSNQLNYVPNRGINNLASNAERSRELSMQFREKNHSAGPQSSC